MVSMTLLSRTHETQGVFFDVIALQRLFQHRRVTFKLLMLRRASYSVNDFDAIFKNKQMELPSRLADTYPRGEARYRKLL